MAEAEATQSLMSDEDAMYARHAGAAALPSPKRPSPRAAAPAAPPPPPPPAIGAQPPPAPLEEPFEDEGEGEGEEEDGYTMEHLSAVVRPVFLTMALATLAVAKVRDPAEDAALGAGLNSYLVYGSGSSGSGGGGSSSGGGGSSSGGSSAVQLGQAAVNALVIVCVICAATFGLVLCYKFRCMRLMIGYLMLSSASLLGYSGGVLVSTALHVGGVSWDIPSLLFIMYNFAVVGVVAVFWQKGVPRIVTQGYLVCVSVIMAWSCA